MCGNRSPRVVTETAPPPSLYTVRDARIRHRKFLELIEFQVDGIPYPDIEIVHYSPVVTVIPYDFERQIVYMVEQARFAAWLDHCARPRLDDPNASPGNIIGDTISWEEISYIGFPSGRMDKRDIKSTESLARQELLEEVGFDRPEREFHSSGTYHASIGNSDEPVSFYFVSVSGTPTKPTGDGTERLRVWEVPLEELDAFLGRWPIIGLSTALGVRLLRERLQNTAELNPDKKPG